MNWRQIARSRGMQFLIALAFTAGFVALRTWDPLPLQILRLKTFDVYQRMHPRVDKKKQPVAIIDIDEASLKKYGQWPWPRTLLAKLVNRLMAMQPAVIGFDAVFPEPDRMSPSNLLASMHGLDGKTREALSRLPSNDQVFADAMKHGRVVLGIGGTDHATPDTAMRPYKTNFAFKGRSPMPYVLAFPGAVRNMPILEQAAKGLGTISLKPEIDGLVRRVPLVVRLGKRLVPTLSVEMLRVVIDAMTPDEHINTLVVKTGRDGIQSVIIPDFREIPTDSIGRTWINYAPRDPSIYIPAKDVLDGTVNPSRIEGHLLLVGTSAVGLLDVKSTPLSGAVPGVDVHAQLLETILSKTYLSRPNYAFGVEIALLVAVCLLLAVTVTRLGPVAGLAAGATVLGAAAAVSWHFYVSQRLLFDVNYAAICGTILYTVLIFLNFQRGDAERRWVRTAFSQYMSPALVEQLARRHGELKLGGEMKDMTVLFCDIRGFTSISELYRDDPQGLTRFINHYLTPLTDTVLAHGGTIDKYMGDCVMAFWNAPLDDPDHARHACTGAIGMIKAVADLNATMKAEAEAKGDRFVPIRIGIGINSGMICVGNMGSAQRFDYSVLGDDVNLASRLEGQSKTYITSIVVGQGTRQRAPDFALLEMDLIKVKGKQLAERVYTLLGDKAVATDPVFQSLAECQSRMLDAYRGQHWREARALVEKCRQINSGRFELSGLFALYDERIAAFEQSPPPDDWDGVYVATEK